MKFELHCHSTCSKGRNITFEGTAAPARIARVLKKKGFGGFALTDHDSIKGWPEARKEAKKLGLLFVPGLEVTTASGHLLALWINEFIEPGSSVEETMEAIHAQGGIGIAAHPFDLRGEGIRGELKKTDAVEVFNALNITRVENLIAKHKAARAGMPGVGGSDAHSLEMMGVVENDIDADDADSMLREIKKGRVRIEKRYITVPEVTAWVRERMRISYEDTLRYIEENYRQPKRGLARFMMRRFVSSKSPLWNSFGYLGLSLSALYGIARSVPYLADIK